MDPSLPPRDGSSDGPPARPAGPPPPEQQTPFPRPGVRAAPDLALFRAVFDQAAVGIVGAWPDGRLLAPNPGFCQFVGYTAGELERMTIADLTHPDDRAADADQFRRMGAGECDGFAVDKRYVRKDGGVVWADVTVTQVRTPDGRPHYAVAVVQDITDRKRAEAGLRASEDRYHRLAEDAPDIIYRYRLRPAPGYDYINRAVTAVKGYTPAEHYADPQLPLKIVHPDDRAELEAIIRDPAAHPNGMLRWRHKDGRVVWTEQRVTPILGPGGEVVAIEGVARDVTERRKAEEAARHSDRRKQAVLAAAFDPIITIDHRGVVVEANPATERVFGYRPADMVGRLMEDLIVPPAQREAHRRSLERYLATGEARLLGRRVELTGLRADGTEFPIELAVTAIETGGEPLFTGYVRDLTDRRRLEEQYRQSQKMEAVGRLAGGVAHDFNNLLTVINGYGEVVLSNLPEGHPARDMVREIRGAGERAAALTRQLLAFSRKQPAAPQVLDLNALVRDLDRLLRRMIGEDVELTTVTDPELWPVEADAGHLEQVVMNLVVNARDAMPTGGQLTVETRNVVLDEAYAQTRAEAKPGPHVLLAVTDTGVGMDAATRDRAFEPFFTTKGEGKGTGLGLATVYGAVKQAGGHVALYSELGKGTTVKVYLPAAGVPAAAAPDRAAPRAMPRGTETVLLVEDEDAVRALSRHVLKGCGYAVLEAEDGKQAVRVGEHHGGPIDLLVTDVVMPHLGGREVAERLAGPHPGMRVLFLSGYTDDAVVRHGLLAREVAFLQKPFTPAELARKVREVLDRPPPAN